MTEVQAGYHTNTSFKDDCKQHKNMTLGKRKNIQNHATTLNNFRILGKGYLFECIDDGVVNERKLY